MKSLWLWFLRQVHKLSMTIALWSKNRVDSFALPAPEVREAGQPPADWLARVQQASQPPAHWLEYIQSKTGQMPVMQDMAAIAQESAALPPVQEKPPVVKEEQRKTLPKVRTEIDELPVPQSKEEAILSYQSPKASRIPERLQWRIQKPAGKSVFDTAELQKGRGSEATYPNLQENNTSPVNYAVPEQNAKPAEFIQHKPEASAQGETVYNSPEHPAKTESQYQQGNSIPKPAADYASPEHPPQDSSAEYAKLEHSAKSDASYTAQGERHPAPEAFVDGQRKQAPQQEAVFKAPNASPQGETAYNSPEHPAKTESQYQQGGTLPKPAADYTSPEHPQQGNSADYAKPEHPTKSDASYSKPEHSQKSDASYTAQEKTYRDNSLDFASQAERRDSSSSYSSPQSSGSNEASYQPLNAPAVPNADYASPKHSDKPAPAPQARKEQKATPAPQYSGRADGASLSDAAYQQAQNPVLRQSPLANRGNETDASRPNYPQVEQSAQSQTRFVSRATLDDAKSALAKASADYWIALPTERDTFEDSGEKKHQARLDAEQRGEF